MKITNLNNTEKKEVNMEGASKAFKQIPISVNDGSPNSAWRVFTVQPGGYTPYHQHHFEHLNYVIEGSGFIIDKNENRREIKKGDFVLVTPNEKHQYRNASEKEDFIMICGVPKEYE